MKVLMDRCETNCTAFPTACINQDLYMAMAQRLVEDGYAAVGYKYVNVLTAGCCSW